MDACSDRLSKSEIEQLLRDKSERATVEFHEKGKGDIRKYFKLISVDGIRQNFVLCEHCNSVIAYSGKTGTGGLTRHTCSRRQRDLNQPQVNVSSIKRKIPPARSQRVKEVTVTFIAKDLRPFDIVDGEGFRKLAQELVNIRADYGRHDIGDVLASRTAISRFHLPHAYHQLRDLVSHEVRNSSTAFTTDLWSDSYTQRSFLALTSHFIDEDFVLKERNLGTIQFKERKTAENI